MISMAYPDEPLLSTPTSLIAVDSNFVSSSSAHLEPDYEDTPTDYCKDQAVFDVGVVPL